MKENEAWSDSKSNELGKNEASGGSCVCQKAVLAWVHSMSSHTLSLTFVTLSTVSFGEWNSNRLLGAVVPAERNRGSQVLVWPVGHACL